MFGVTIFNAHMHRLPRATLGNAIARGRKYCYGAELGLFTLFMTMLYFLAKT